MNEKQTQEALTDEKLSKQLRGISNFCDYIEDDLNRMTPGNAVHHTNRIRSQIDRIRTRLREISDERSLKIYE